jgi:hypothetical protein
MAVIIDGSAGITTPGETNTGNLSVSGTTTLTTPLPVASGGTGATSLSGIAVGNLTGGSNGTIPYQSASGTTQMLAVGTSGQVLQTNGAGAPSWITPSAGAMTLISTQVGNGSSQSISWTGLSTYTKYILVVNSIQLSGASFIEIQFGYGSTTWYTSGYTNQTVYSTSTSVATFGGGAGGIQFNGNNVKATTAPGMFASAIIQIGDGSTIYPSAVTQAGYLNSSASAIETTNTSGYQTTVSNQVNAIRIFSNQLLNTGSASLYGISS